MTACMPLITQSSRFIARISSIKAIYNHYIRIRMSVGGIAIHTPNYKSAAFPRFAEH
jgi:hypothetical protein